MKVMSGQTFIGLLAGLLIGFGAAWFAFSQAHDHDYDHDHSQHEGEHDHAHEEPKAQEAVETETITTPPAYMIVTGEVLDRPAFGAGYAAKLPPLYATYGGTYIAIGRGVEHLEGEGTFQSYVISKWPSKQAALDFWKSPEYDVLRRARIDGNWGKFDVFLVEGLAETTQTAPMVSQVPKE
jgi:uncharacterized protein (DUF1330 family)